ncbi:MAG TPA: ROK family protein [Terriglobales bacterium]|jgi:glucokinase
MPSFSIGVDLGGTNLRIAAVDSEGNLLQKLTVGAQISRGRDHVIEEMCKAIQSLSGGFKEKYSLTGVGIGVPGIIEKKTGRVIKSPNLPDWLNYPVKEEIERRLQSMVILENDANSAALGEYWLGAARDAEAMIIITLGTGVGGGIIMNGDIWEGMTGMAGEFGHINIEPEGHPCNCGSRGCAEQLASATAIVRMAKEAIASGKAEGLAKAARGDVEFTAKSVFNLALQGDEAAQAIFNKVGWALGILLSDLVNSFNFPIYVVGGGVSSAWQAFAPALFKEVHTRSMVYAATAPPIAHETEGAATTPKQSQKQGRTTTITRALLGSDAGLFGAARLPALRATHP